MRGAGCGVGNRFKLRTPNLLNQRMTLPVQPPLIGITTPSQRDTRLFCLRSEYVDAVRLAGGVPVLLTPGEPEECAAILERLDGLVFTGGGDLDPAIYNGASHPTIYSVDQGRDRFELTLAQTALNTDIPVLGICRGLEVLVVASGGDLVAHVPDEFGALVEHRAEQAYPSEHRVQIAPESYLAKVIRATDVTVVSWHHQAARTAPPKWTVTAHAADGVIEALEHEQHPWAIALQWHPELSINDPLQQRIFRALVAAASRKPKA